MTVKARSLVPFLIAHCWTIFFLGLGCLLCPLFLEAFVFNAGPSTGHRYILLSKGSFGLVLFGASLACTFVLMLLHYSDEGDDSRRDRGATDAFTALRQLRAERCAQAFRRSLWSYAAMIPLWIAFIVAGGERWQLETSYTYREGAAPDSAASVSSSTAAAATRPQTFYLIRVPCSLHIPGWECSQWAIARRIWSSPFLVQAEVIMPTDIRWKFYGDMSQTQEQSNRIAAEARERHVDLLHVRTVLFQRFAQKLAKER